MEFKLGLSNSTFNLGELIGFICLGILIITTIIFISFIIDKIMIRIRVEKEYRYRQRSQILIATYVCLLNITDIMNGNFAENEKIDYEYWYNYFLIPEDMETVFNFKNIREIWKNPSDYDRLKSYVSQRLDEIEKELIEQ